MLLATVGEAAVVDLVTVQLVALPEAQLLHVVLQGRLIQWNFGNYTLIPKPGGLVFTV